MITLSPARSIHLFQQWSSERPIRLILILSVALLALSFYKKIASYLSSKNRTFYARVLGLSLITAIFLLVITHRPKRKSVRRKLHF